AGVRLRRLGGVVQEEMAGGTESAVFKSCVADGRAARQVAGRRAQGGVGAPAGVQPGARVDGRGGAVGGGAAGRAELHGGAARAERLPAEAGRGADGGRGVAAVESAAGDDRPAAGGGPARPLRAAGAQAAAEELP